MNPFRQLLQSRRFRVFDPILAGATVRERAIACIAAPLAIALTITICHWIVGGSTHLPWIIAPIGASTVMLFTIPASPLAQPWPIIGGSTLSAIVGVTVAYLVPEPVLGAAIAVSLAIAVMSLARCLHPPGGGIAMLAVLGGEPVTAAGFLFPFTPVAMNVLVLVTIGYTFHKLMGRRYPHVPARDERNNHGTVDLPPTARSGFNDADVDAALANLDATFDIDRQDLKRLLLQVQMQALVRSHGDLKCADIMSRDVIKVRLGDTVETTAALLLRHNIRTLPVVDRDGRLVGTVGLRELANASGTVDRLMSLPATASEDAPAMSLVSILTDGRTQAVIIVDAERRILGLITQTDLLSTLARALPETRQAA